ncbi:MAG: 16S rRNA (uracil(1498)-N(3))-methyltransferase [Chitinophagaceae bacterium]|nr:16S rRNA (uracil(1498)-N(3))-methyltransferase [Chitinophagaceae bacterium]
MALPFFYIAGYDPLQKEVVLDEDTSRHVIQVLRMKVGEQLNLTDGRGGLLTCEIVDEHKKHCTVTINSKKQITNPKRKVTIAISLLKNADRFEWFLEKATEIGVNEIIPLICERTEKEKFRHDRMNTICISAMLQSQQCWLPVLHEPVGFEDLVVRQFDDGIKFIAHCEDANKESLGHFQIGTSSDRLIAIGPEGDFSKKEIEQATQQGFIPVSLGETRLRSETAGVVAATFLYNK